LPGTAAAAPTAVDLTVEAGGKALMPAAGRILTDTTTVATDKRQPACGGTGASKTLPGPTATGALLDAATAVPALAPVGISDKFSFGLLVCGVGTFTSSDSAFWLYKVNHVSPEVGGEQYTVKPNDQVLWYFQDTALNRNGGDELAIEAPARAEANSPFDITVVSYSFNGAKKAAPGAKVYYPGGQALSGPDGKVSISLPPDGWQALRAGRGNDIPSPVTKVCVLGRLDLCPAYRGRRIFGTPKADRLAGTAGNDVVSAGAGNDRIYVRGGGKDRVRCGSGGDTVRLGRGDRAARDCERVLKRR
jgi:hypothetical protein